jgi:lipoate-protein ligase A
VGELHRREPPTDGRRHAWFVRPVRPALVLGSTQPAAHVDEDALAEAGIELVRRRSGGGAVLVEAGDLVWVDLLVGRDDPLWYDDVGRAAHWVGRLWAAVLAELGVEADVHTGGLERGPYGERVCFAGLGAGELTVDGRKVVGVSQRRTRDVARFQTSALLRWRPERLAGLLAMTDAARAVLAGSLATAAVGLVDLEVGIDVAGLEAVVERHLDRG